MRYSIQMARSTARLLLTVVLALLSSETAMRSVNVAAEFKTICGTGCVRNRGEQHKARDRQSDRVAAQAPRPAQIRALLVPVQSDTILVFQLPPPVLPLLS